MDDNLAIIIAIIATAGIGAVGSGIWYKLKKFIGSAHTLLENLQLAIADKEITDIEVKQSIKDIQVFLADGLGLWSTLLGLFKR